MPRGHTKRPVTGAIRRGKLLSRQMHKASRDSQRPGCGRLDSVDYLLVGRLSCASHRAGRTGRAIGITAWGGSGPVNIRPPERSCGTNTSKITAGCRASLHFITRHSRQAGPFSSRSPLFSSPCEGVWATVFVSLRRRPPCYSRGSCRVALHGSSQIAGRAPDRCVGQR